MDFCRLVWNPQRRQCSTGALGRRGITRCGFTLHAAAIWRFQYHGGPVSGHDSLALRIATGLICSFKLVRPIARGPADNLGSPALKATQSFLPDREALLFLPEKRTLRSSTLRQLNFLVNQKVQSSNPVSRAKRFPLRVSLRPLRQLNFAVNQEVQSSNPVSLRRRTLTSKSLWASG